MSERFGWLQVICGFLLMVISSGCSTLNQYVASPPSTTIPTSPSTPPKSTLEAFALPTDTSIPSALTPQPAEITFEVVFDKNYHCTVVGPTEVPTGEYLFLLNNQSDRKVDIAVTLLIDGHTYQDLLDLQSETGVPFVKVYWMSQPYYYTKDHQVWNYSFDETGEHVILILQHVFEGAWICDPFMVTETATEK
jgi:hypothetical protein